MEDQEKARVSLAKKTARKGRRTERIKGGDKRDGRRGLKDVVYDDDE